MSWFLCASLGLGSVVPAGHFCVLVHVGVADEVGAVGLVWALKYFLIVLGRFFLSESFFVIHVSRLSLLCYLVCSLRPCCRLLGKGLPLGFLVSGVLLVFFHAVSHARCGS